MEKTIDRLNVVHPEIWSNIKNTASERYDPVFVCLWHLC